MFPPDLQQSWIEIVMFDLLSSVEGPSCEEAVDDQDASIVEASYFDQLPLLQRRHHALSAWLLMIQKVQDIAGELKSQYDSLLS